MLRVQRDDRLARQGHIAQQELQQETLALAGVAQDDGAAVGLVRGPPVQVQDDIGTILMLALSPLSLAPLERTVAITSLPSARPGS